MPLKGSGAGVVGALLAIVLHIHCPAGAQEQGAAETYNAFTVGLHNFQADELYEQGRFREAAAKWEKILVWVDEKFGEDSTAFAFYANSLALAYRQLGEWLKAQDLQERVLAAARSNFGDEHPQTQSVLRNLAAIRRALGDLEGARELGEQALEIALRTLEEDDPQLWIAKGNLAVTLKDLGEIALARELEEEVVRARRRIFGDDHPATLTAISNLAWTHATQGDLRGALALAEKALEARRRRQPEHLDTLNAMNQLAILLQEKGEIARARQLQAEAVAGFTRLLGERHSRTLKALTNLASIALLEGNAKLARSLDEKIYETRRELYGDEHPDTLKAMYYLARSQREAGDSAAARELFEKALALRQRLTGGPLGTWEDATLLWSLARLHRDHGRMEEAGAAFSETLDVLERQILKVDVSEDVRSLFRAYYGAYYRDAAVNALDRGRPSEAFHVTERFRAQSLRSELLAGRRSRTPVPPEAEARRRELGLRYDAVQRDLDRLEDGDQERTALLREQEELRRDLAVVRAEIRQAVLGEDWRLPVALDVAAVRKALDPGTSLLSYQVGVDETLLFVLPPAGGLEVHRLDAGAEALASQVRNFRDLIETGSADSRRAVAVWLYDKLLRPADAHLAASERLLLLLDGALHRLPFAALERRGEDGQHRYLVEWKPLHSAASASVYAELRRRGGLREAALQLAAFGDPFYGEEESRSGVELSPAVRSAVERGGFVRLEDSRREVLEIGALFPPGDVQVFVEKEAREETVKQLAGQTRILHLATHGVNLPDASADSFLALSLPGGADRDNGVLQAWEISQGPRLETDLVVLSACETGVGKYRDGEGPLSLGRAFLAAGARTVVTSLWRVKDRSTTELMIRFYRHLRRGLPKDEALRAAQVELLSGPVAAADGSGNLDFTSPYHWAAFQVTGDWQ